MPPSLKSKLYFTIARRNVTFAPRSRLPRASSPTSRYFQRIFRPRYFEKTRSSGVPCTFLVKRAPRRFAGSNKVLLIFPSFSRLSFFRSRSRHPTRFDVPTPATLVYLNVNEIPAEPARLFRLSPLKISARRFARNLEHRLKERRTIREGCRAAQKGTVYTRCK